MTIPEEIEQLKIKLGQAADEREQMEVLLKLLNRYPVIPNTAKPYIDRLLHLAEKLNNPINKAWGLYYFARLKSKIRENDLSINLLGEARSLFEQEGDKSGVAYSIQLLAIVYQLKGNFPEALTYHIDSLKMSEDLGDKRLTVICLNNMGSIFVVQGKLSEALENFFTALKLSKEIGDKRCIAQSYNKIGIAYKGSNIHEAQKNYFASLKLMEEIGDKHGIAGARINIAISYIDQSNYPEALHNLFAALKLSEEVGDMDLILTSYSNIGDAYMTLGNGPDALKNYFAALEISEKLANKYGASNIYNNIGQIYYDQGNYPEAIKNFNAGLKISEEMGNKWSMAHSYSCIGRIHSQQGNYTEALNILSASLKLREEMEDKRGMAESLKYIGDIYQNQGNGVEALRYYFDSLKFAEELDVPYTVKECSLGLTNTYKAMHDFENALTYYEKYHEVEKEMLGEESTKQINNLSFMHNLEQKEKDLEIEQLRNVDLKRERDRSESLLLNILPAEVAEELKDKGTAGAKLFDEVTVLFTDFKGFTTVSERLTPQQLVDELHACFSAFDGMMHKHGIEKIKTVGDAYLAVCGLPIADDAHAGNIIKAAIDIREFMLSRRKELGEMTFEIRIGVHTGSVVAGIVGVKKFAYDIWGDTVNTAARMEQNSEAGRINISQTTYERVKDNFSCTYRGEIEAKNKGRLKMYFVN